MRRGLGFVVLGVGVVAAVAVSVAAYLLAGYSWNQVAGYRSPYLAANLPEAGAGPAATRRVVLVIVDGMRNDTSLGMRTLQTLREHGQALTLTASQPSLSFPDWTCILSGAPQRISGVTTNGFKGRVPVETLLDTALSRGTRLVAVGPSVLGSLFGADRGAGHYFRDYKGQYLSSDLVIHAVRMTESLKPGFLLLHLPDLDEAGHAYGAASKQYAAAAARIDTDLSVLVNALEDGHTTFVIVADHGHTAAGGHGGWEPEVVQVPAVLAGSGVALGSGTGRLEDLAPTVAGIAGWPSPRDAVGRMLTTAMTDASLQVQAPEIEQRDAMLANVLDVVEGTPHASGAASQRSFAGFSEARIASTLAAADDARLSRERRERLPMALAVGGVGLLALIVVGAMSWRALASALAGVAAYYAVYDGLYFGVHRLAWSLSAINSEDKMSAFFDTRLAEAALAGLVAAAVAGLVYPLLRERPKGASGEFLPGWLSLGPATVLAVQATLAMQVAWYLWRWGATVTWIIPDLHWAFKYDLDLLQAVGLGVAASLSWLVTLLVGRYHPRVPRLKTTRAAVQAGEE
jgi:hypothetical protein